MKSQIFTTITLFLFFLLTLSELNAQRITNIETMQSGNQIVVKYKIKGARFNQQFKVDLYMSKDGGENYIGPLKAVEGDVGEGVEEGKKTIRWNVFNEVNSLEGDIVFDVRADIVEKEIPREFFAMYSGSDVAYAGLMVGMVGKISWYASIKSGLFLEKTDYEYGGADWEPETGENTYYTINDFEDTRRLSVTAGATFQLGKHIFLYTGGGYGQKETVIQMDIYEYQVEDAVDEAYVSYPDYSYNGAEAEAGIMLRFGNVLLSAGATTLNFEYSNVTFGAGWVF